jgi:hypothetical protein
MSKALAGCFPQAPGEDLLASIWYEPSRWPRELPISSVVRAKSRRTAYQNEGVVFLGMSATENAALRLRSQTADNSL